MHCPVCKGCRIYRLHLCGEVRPPPTMSVLDMTLNNLMVRFQSCWNFGKCRVPLYSHQGRMYYKSDVRLYSKVLSYLWAGGSWSLTYVYFGSISSLIHIWLNIIDIHHFVIHPSLMMPQGWAESTREITNYRRFINQFPPNITRSIRQFERINKNM